MSENLSTTDFIRIIAKKCNQENDVLLDPKSKFREHNFPHKIVLVGSDSGYYTAKVNEKNEVLHVSDQWLRLEIYKFCNSYAELDYWLDMMNCYKVMDRLLGYVPRYTMEDINPISQLSDNSLCFKRLPFNLDEIGETPLFDEMMDRWGPNAVNLMKFIGSIFDPKADRQRYCWVYGDGLDGKGSLIQVLKEVFGQTMISTTVPNKSDNFWTASLVGKRLVMFPDENHYQFPTSGLFKSLTGGDPMKIEAKYKNSITLNLNCMFMFFSNEKPNIDEKKANTRRLIYVECKSYQGKIADNYIDMLKIEAPQWLSRCYQEYKIDPQFHGAEDIANELAEENLEEYTDLFESYFVRGPNFQVLTSRVSEICKAYGHMKQDREIGKFYQAIEHVYKCTRKRIGKINYLMGCKIMSTDERSKKFGEYSNH